jgi:hypothetical protein
VGTVAIASNRHVAIVAEDTIARKKAIGLVQFVDDSVGADGPPLASAAAVNVVDGQELDAGFATALAPTTIAAENLGPDLLSPPSVPLGYVALVFCSVSSPRLQNRGPVIWIILPPSTPVFIVTPLVFLMTFAGLLRVRRGPSPTLLPVRLVAAVSTHPRANKNTQAA